MQQIIKGGATNSFYVIDLNSIRERVKLWFKHFPTSKLRYAVKTNCDDMIVAEMVRLGSGFDCASLQEIEQVLRLGGDPAHILFANPCKQVSHIEYARDQGVKAMTFDSSEEAEKIHQVYPTAVLILRISVKETDAPCPMGMKFGAPKPMWNSILDTCKKLKMKVKGVSFHVGSGGCSFQAYKDAILDAKCVFQMAQEKGMPAMDILDIGGGFSMNAEDPQHNFDVIAPQVTKFINEQFPSQKLALVGEPGRFISQFAQSLAVNVFLAKQQQDIRHLYINNGVYQGFGCKVFDQENLKGQPLLPATELRQRMKSEVPTFIWGQTCDGVDYLSKDITFPYVKQGEWLVYRNLGAYNESLECRFNGFDAPKTYYIQPKSN